MKNQANLLGRQIISFLDLCQNFNNCSYSSGTRQCCYRAAVCMADEITVILDVLIEKSSEKLLVGIFDFQFLAMLCTDKKWNVPLDLEDSESPLYQEFKLKFEEVKDKVAQLDDNVCSPDSKLCEAYFKTLLTSRMYQELKAEVKRVFERWKRDHLRFGSKEDKKKRLFELLKKLLLEFLETKVLDSVDPIKSEEELEAAMNDLDFASFEKAGVDYRKLYRMLLELVDCRRDSKHKLLAYVPNKENLGRFVYMHWSELGEEGKQMLCLFICQLDAVQEALYPEEKAEELNYSEPAEALKEVYLPKCKDLLNKGYDLAWAKGLIDQLMDSPLRDDVARHWADDAKRKRVVADFLGAMIELGALEDNKLKLARLYFKDEKKAKSLANYIGHGKESSICLWVVEHCDVA